MMQGKTIAVCVCFLTFLILTFMFFALTAKADFLACDVVTGFTPTQSKVEITPPTGPAVVISGIVTVSGTNVKLLDLAPYTTPGAYKFRAKWADSTGWWSDFSPFLSPNKPPTAGGLTIVP